ncbi:arylsulfatase [Novosphingobium sp. PS1R-30]|uniref:Arylsulfatase n=1 Tax=Novosphingobium anseongense TaxID=3133436 RepID=A0ABU8RR32_9SPHN
MPHRRWIRLAATLCCTALALPSAQARPASRPNVLVIVADDLGFSDLGAFGGEIATPNLDALALSGLRLANFHTEAACAPTRAMLLTGSDSHRVGLGNMPESMAPNQAGRRGYEGHLRADTATLAERLSAGGYRTLFSGKWHLGTAPDQDPHARGFQHSFAMLNCCHDHFGQGLSTDRSKMFGYTRNGETVTSLPADFYSSDFFASQLIDQLRATRSESPFFAYLAFTAPHAPLQAPPATIAKYRGRYDAGYDVLREQRLERQRKLGLLAPAAQPHRPVDTVPWESLSAEERRTSSRKMEIYAAMVEELDKAIGRVIAELKAEGEFARTTIVFLSDNGAEARDPAPRPGTPIPPLATLGGPKTYANYGAGWAQAATAPSWRFKSFATEGGIHAPAFVSGPVVRRPGTIGRAYTNARDVAPTLLDLAGVAVTPGRFAGRDVPPIDGLSWRGLLAGKAAVYPPDRAVGSELFGSRSLRRGDWKITDIGDGIWHLFDLARDPGETRDLAAAEPARKAALIAEWDRYARDVGVVLPDPPFHPNPPRDHD